MLKSFRSSNLYVLGEQFKRFLRLIFVRLFNFCQATIISVRHHTGTSLFHCGHFHKTLLQYRNMVNAIRCHSILWHIQFYWVVWSAVKFSNSVCHFCHCRISFSHFYCRLIAMFFILPETEKRSLEDIELHYSDDTKKITDINIRINNHHSSNNRNNNKITE